MSYLYIKSNERFSSNEEERDNQRAKYDRAFDTYIRKIWIHENTQNLTVKELEEIHHPRFYSCMWDWENHCLIPEIKEDVRRKWRMIPNKDGLEKDVYEIWDENRMTWRVMDAKGKMI